MGCNTEIPVVVFSACNPDIRLSEIEYIYAALRTAVPFIDITNTIEWEQRISNTGIVPLDSPFSTADLIREISVVADKPAPSITEKDISHGRKIILKTEHFLNVEIDECNDVNYEFARLCQCGSGLHVKCWFKTKDGSVFGENEGYYAVLLLQPILERGIESIEKYVGTLKWVENCKTQSTEMSELLIDFDEGFVLDFDNNKILIN